MRDASSSAVVLAAVAGLALAASALGAAPKYTLTPIPVPGADQTAYRLLHAIGEDGTVVGQVLNSRAFKFTPGVGAVDLHPMSSVIGSKPLAVNPAGQVLGDACVPPPGGNGTCGSYVFRHSPSTGNRTIDWPTAARFDGPVWNARLNASGAVALQVHSWDAAHTSNEILVWNDAAGWSDLTAFFPTTQHSQVDLIDFNDRGEVLCDTGWNLPIYLYTPGSGGALVMPAGSSATDLNNLGAVVGRYPGGQAARVWPGHGVTMLDPQNRFPGATPQKINDQNMVAGVWRSGFFLYTDAAGMTNAGAFPVVPDPGMGSAAAVYALNSKGEFTGGVLEGYQMVPVIKAAGQALKKVQDVIDPARATIIVTGVTGINDAGQFAVHGVPPTGNDFTERLSFLVTPAAPAKCDFDADGAVTLADLFAYLTGWFALDPRCDTDAPAGVDLSDLFGFISAWFQEM